MKEIYKYQCSTNRETSGCFRQACTVCNCAPFHKNVLDPGTVKTNEQIDLTCPHSGEKLKLIDAWQEEQNNSPAIFGFRMNENQVRADRMKRSKKHFKDEVFPNLPKSEQKVFVQQDSSFKKKT